MPNLKFEEKNRWVYGLFWDVLSENECVYIVQKAT